MSRVRRSLALQLSDPVALAVGEGAVWVAARDVDGHAVLRVDPQTGEVIATIPIPPREVTDPVSGATVLSSNEPTDIAVGPGAVWLTSGQAGTAGLAGTAHSVLSRIDPATNQVVATIEIERALSVDANDSSGGVWVTGPGQAVSRIDPATNEVAATIDVPDPGVVTVRGEDVWIGGDGVTRLDAGQEEVVTVVDVRGADDQLFIGSSLAIGTSPNGMAASAGSVWVAVL